MRGGSRPGAGRPPGSLNRKSREIVEKALGEGVTPLEVMLHAMRFYHAEAEKLIERLLAEGVPHLKTAANGGGAEGPRADVIEAIREVLELRKRAGEEAARAAPYVHPRIGYAGEDRPADPDFVPLAERLKAYARRDEHKAADGNLFELKSPGDQSSDPSGSEPPPIN